VNIYSDPREQHGGETLCYGRHVGRIRSICSRRRWLFFRGFGVRIAQHSNGKEFRDSVADAGGVGRGDYCSLFQRNSFGAEIAFFQRL